MPERKPLSPESKSHGPLKPGLPPPNWVVVMSEKVIVSFSLSKLSLATPFGNGLNGSSIGF